MPRGNNVKATKSSDRKRAVSNTEVKYPRKRQKTEVGHDLEIPKELEAVQSQLPTPPKCEDQVFRFLDLPGELRNRIYEFAADWARRCFPHTHARDKPPNRRRHLLPQHSTTPPPTDPVHSPAPPPHFPQPIPYLPLTQVCSLIRSEFRPMFLSTHRFPLPALAGYFKSFFPLPSRHTDLKRFNSYYSPAGALRLWIRQDDLSNTDILRLLKHKVRFPHYSITLDFAPGALDKSVADVVRVAPLAVIDNKSAKWVGWIKGNVVTQVRLVCRGFDDGRLRVVVKERYAPGWMKPTLDADRLIPEGYLESLGLDKATGLKVNFGVDYS